MPWPYFTTTPIFDRCALRFPQSGSIGEIEIPIHVTKLDTVTTNATVNMVSYGPLIDLASNTAAGGMAISHGISEVPKLVMEGFIDTPTVLSSVGATPSQSQVSIPGIVIDGFRVTYAEIIAAYFEGRTQTNIVGGNVYWQRVDPEWFRDPMGRVYTSPRILAYSATRLEAAPGRNNFTITLDVAASSSSTVSNAPFPSTGLYPATNLYP